MISEPNPEQEASVAAVASMPPTLPSQPNPPSLSVIDGRTTNGRFAPGNRLSKGNSSSRRMAALRHALLAAVSREDIAAVVRKLTDMAQDGDVPAAKLLLEHTCGRPTDGTKIEINVATAAVTAEDELQAILRQTPLEQLRDLQGLLAQRERAASLTEGNQ